MIEPEDPATDPEETFRDVMEAEHWIAAPYHDEEVATGIIEAVDDHFLTNRTSGLAETIYRSWRMYHSMDAEGYSSDHGYPISSPQFLGEQGEFTYLQVGHYRNAIRHKIALVTSERPAFEPHASTNDPDAIEQVATAGNVLDYAMDQRGVNQVLHNACETGVLMGGSYVMLSWDHDAGDLVPRALTNLEVVHQEARDWGDVEWVIARTFESRWRLAAEADAAGNPELGVEIAKADFGAADYQFSPVHYHEDRSIRSERIPVYHFFHKSVPHMPGGRYTRVTGDALVLQDGPSPFVEIPVYRFAPNEFVGTSTPFANAWDVMALHTMANAITSAMVSRIDAYGVSNVVYTEGTEFGVDDLNGLTLTSIPPGFAPPTPLDVLPNNPMLPNTQAMIEGMIDKISGINSVVRGQPADNISSGSMAALVEAQAVKFNSPDEAAYTYLAEKVGTGIIKMYQAFADEEMLITVSGESDRIVKQFKADAIDKIARVSVQRTNPLTKTNAWKQDAANQMLAQGTIDSPQEYMGVVKTGRFESLFTDDVALLAHIKDENSRLLRGEPVQAGQIERHDLHVQEHAGQLDSRIRESNPQAAQALQMHIMEHLKHWMESSMSNPALLAALGMQPLPPPPAIQMQMQQMAGGQPGGQPAPGDGKPGPAPDGKVKGTNAAAGADREPGMPGPPTNPSTGEKADI